MSRTYSLLSLGIMAILISSQVLAQPPGGMPPATVEVAKIQKHPLQSAIDLVGRVESPKTSRVSAEVEGLIAEFSLNEGDYVKQGGTIAVLENSTLKIELLETQAQLKKAEAKLLELKHGSRPQEIEKARAAMLEAKNRWEKEIQDANRNQELYEKKVLSEREYNNSILDKQAAEQVYLQRKAAYELMVEGVRQEEIAQEEATLEGRQAQVKLLEDKIRKTVIKAPFNGALTGKLVEKGEWVNSGKAVAELIQIDPLRVEIPVPESIIGQVKPGNEARIKFDALGDKEFKGKISQVIPEADSSTKTFPVKILLSNPNKELRVGMTARVTLSYGGMQSAIMVPKDAVVVTGNQRLIYVADRENIAQMITVTTGRSSNSLIEITSRNVKEGSLVVVKGNERLRPGQPLNIVKQNKSAEK